MTMEVGWFGVHRELCDTVKSHFKALGLCNFQKGFLGGLINGGAYIRGGLISWIKKNVSERQNKMYLRNKLKAYIPLHFEATFILHLLCVTKQLVYVCNLQLKTLTFKKKRKRNTLLQ